jgi:hypothetical protein
VVLARQRAFPTFHPLECVERERAIFLDIADGEHFRLIDHLELHGPLLVPEIKNAAAADEFHAAFDRMRDRALRLAFAASRQHASPDASDGRRSAQRGVDVFASSCSNH